MHSRVLRTECNVLNKRLTNNLFHQKRVSIVRRLPALQQRRTASIVPSASSSSPPEIPDDAEKPSARRGRPKTVKGLDSKSGETVNLPPELADSLIWLPEENLNAKESSLPPEEMIQEALSHLLVSFHPKTQHRATYPSSAGPPIEPSVTLYSPIEGGTYVIDATVQELARRTDADVLILDALDILAGEWGPFGKAASCLQLPSNPLQLGEFHASQPVQRADESDDEEEAPNPIHQMMEGIQLGGGRPPFGITIRTRKIGASGSSQSAKKTFFQEFVNLQRSDEEASSNSKEAFRPRLIYCRDLHLVSEVMPHWFPHFIEAVRSRRQGPMARPQLPVSNPTVVILGVSPSIITPRTSAPSSSGPSGFINLNANSSHFRPRSISPPPNPKPIEWDESAPAQRARDKRLQERLTNWEKYDASVFYPDLPNLGITNEGAGARGPTRGLMGLFVVQDSGGGPPALPPSLMDEGSSRGERATDHSRLSVILPRTRDNALEVATRVERRLQINQINMRTAIGTIGGNLSKAEDLSIEPSPSGEARPEDDRMRAMLIDWSQRVETWSRTKSIADRAMGSFVADKLRDRTEPDKASLDLTPVPWTAISQSWGLERNARTVRKDFLSTFTVKPSKQSTKPGETVEEDEAPDTELSDIEELIEQLKRDPTLDQHEQRLLGCIVNPKHMPTTFAQVHLPPATIDSIRTLVSLPLLHPSAFNHGILKQHGMNGALLFGAPGTGKTLSIRALARESGARMMIIKPSDVMDMYVGEGEKLVRAVFTLARRISPCVVFIDEIDALLGARYTSRAGGGDLAHRGVITEFMQEMDGLRSNRETNVVVIGATNRPFDLDDAVLRRLPRRLLIDLPAEKEREAILRILLADERLADNVSIASLAKRTESFSGSDLKHLCVAAALDAVKEHANLPWSVPQESTAPDSLSSSGSVAQSPETPSTTAPMTRTSENTGATILQANDAQNQGAPTTDANTETETEVETNTDADTTAAAAEETEAETSNSRILQPHHFEKALKEITPSASEQMGTLADLRKWNEEFGEGGRKRGKRIWGGKFGFTVKSGSGDQAEEGRVQQP